MTLGYINISRVAKCYLNNIIKDIYLKNDTPKMSRRQKTKHNSLTVLKAIPSEAYTITSLWQIGYNIGMLVLCQNERILKTTINI